MEKIKWIEEYLTEGMKLAELEGPDRALQLLDKLLYEEPGYSPLHYTIGLVNFVYSISDDKAEQHLKAAIYFDSNNTDAYIMLGKILHEKEKFDDAIQIFKAGLQAEKGNRSDLLFGAAKSYELKRRFGKAISHYKKALGHSADLWNCLVIEESIKRCERKKR